MPFNNEVNPGTRSVDTQQLFYTLGPMTTGFPGYAGSAVLLTNNRDGSTASKLYMGDAVSFTLEVIPETAFPTSTPNTVEVALLWYASDAQTVTGSAIYEVISGQDALGNIIQTLISDRCQGNYVDVWIVGNNIFPAAGGLTEIDGRLSTSSREVSRMRAVQTSLTNPPTYNTMNVNGDGILIDSGVFSLAVNASSSVMASALLCEDWVLSIASSGAGAKARVRGGFGARGALGGGDFAVDYTFVAPAALAASTPDFVIGPFPPMNRPLMVTITNIGSVTGQFNVRGWERGS